MQSSTRRRALESAGKIALGCYFGAVCAGCGGLSDAAVPQPTATAPVPSSPEPSEPTPVLACIAPVEISERRLTTALAPEAQACCKAYVEGVVGTGPTRPGSELALDASLVNCCRALAYEGTFDTSAAHTTCCYGDVLPSEDRQASYCSPWGPPVPPALGVA